MKITFVTTNSRKILEANLACEPNGITVEPVALELDEIQHADHEKIALQKGADAFAKMNKPIVVTDTAMQIPALNGFPGGYAKDVSNWFTSADYINLIRPYEDKRILFTEQIVYTDSETTKLFSDTYTGTIIDPPRGTGNSVENVLEIHGKTMGERRDEGGVTHEPEDYIWWKFAVWYRKYTER